MRKSAARVRTRVAITAAALVLVGGAGLAEIVWNSGVVSLPETSPGASKFTHTFVFNTFPAGTPPVSSAGLVAGFGDIIDGVEIGRDDRGPYTAFTVEFGPGSPHQGVPGHPCYPYGLDATWNIIPHLPGPWDGPGGEPTAGPIDCGIGGDDNHPGPTFRFVYRPTNDPLNPGWTTNPGSAGQLEDGLAACQVVADNIRKYVEAVGAGPGLGKFPTPAGGGAGPGSLGKFPVIVVEVPWSQATSPPSSDAHYLEFYKFRIQNL